MADWAAADGGGEDGRGTEVGSSLSESAIWSSGLRPVVVGIGERHR